MSANTLRVMIDGRLMHYRKAGIAQYTRRLVTALAQVVPASGAGRLVILLDRRDTDTAWLPVGVDVIRTITPAHHRFEQFTLPVELLSTGRHFILHSPDFITARGRFRKVITIHDLYFLEHPDVMHAGGTRYYSRVHWSALHADHIIAVSQFTRGEILRLLPGIPATKVSVIHEAADSQESGVRSQESEVTRSGQESREAVSTPHPTLSTVHSALGTQHSALPYALFVGTFEPRKNLVALLRALQEQPADFRLVIVGESGWGDNEPAQVASALGVAERVTFAGRLSDEQLDACYRSARMLVFPSLSEGFGLPVLEAMARGVPVICSNTGALPEVTGGAAMLHDPHDPATLAWLLRAMWTDDELHDEYRRRGLERVAQFSWARTAQDTWRVYQAVAR
ncbi:MAG: glycosyltransferase family 4 protein [Chloroflexi bacterium]|nr:glycosyltransferase family 4 protein [Chloroflexota bacterium]